MNQDVPTMHVLKLEIAQLKERVKKLERENNRLKSQISSRDRAISDFKKWQSRITEFKCKYWMGEALKFLNIPIDKDTKEILHLLRSSNLDLKEKYVQLKRNFDSLITKVNEND